MKKSFSSVATRHWWTAVSLFAVLLLACDPWSPIVAKLWGQQGAGGAPAAAEAPADGQPATEATAPTLFVQVPLPIQGDVDEVVRTQLEKRLNDLPATGERPVCILEFTATDERGGLGSQFERSLALARYLASERLSRVRTVAYIPKSVQGHAVLAVLACEEIAVAEDTQFGPAGVGEAFIDGSMREAYRNIADRRRTVPATVALGMLDRDLEVLRVELLDGNTRYATGTEMAELQQSGTVSKVETLAAKNDLIQFQGRAMRVKYGFAAHLVGNRKELASELKIAPEALRDDGELAAEWSIVRVDLTGRVTTDQVNRVIRLLQDRLRNSKGCLVVLHIDSPGGSPSDSMRLANFLADIDRQTARTCAFVSGFARCDAALPALACDDLILSGDALLGGPGDRHLSATELEELTDPLRELAKAKHRDWSLLRAMVDPKLQVFECRMAGTGEVRYFSSEERQQQKDPEQWTVGAPLATDAGITAATAQKLGWVRFSAENFEQIPSLYGLSQEAELLEAGWLITRIEHLASQAWFGRTLLFIAFFALISEASAPGVGVPGFISAICFLLFFWAQFLNGTCGWLEVLLFMGGFVFVLIEFFILPGFGIFGIGGAVMMISSIILASQTFILPHNSYQMREMPKSMFAVAMAGLGGVSAIFIMQRYIHQTPWLKNLALPPPDGGNPEVERRESPVDFAHLTTKMGTATTQIAPSGKARFGDDIVDVITDGEVVAIGDRVQVIEVRGNRVLVRAASGGR